MPKLIKDLVLPIEADLKAHLSSLHADMTDFRILRKSVDARRRHVPRYVYTVEVFFSGEKPTEDNFELEKCDYKEDPVLIVGSGPAGLFAALRLVERGIPCKIFEQGSETAKRMMGITRFWRYGELNTRNNVCFGEGGAGLYSDGKLITRIKSPYIPYVMHRLAEFGAPAEIKYVANPHVGSDRIRRVIPKIREAIQRQGGEIFFDTKVMGLSTDSGRVDGVILESGIKVKGSRVILACGHSAEDIFHHLNTLGVQMQGQSFAVGLRVEHSQEAINRIQFREYSHHESLGAANYRLAYNNVDEKFGIYSFCMCPGGYVLSSGTEPDGTVTNGMSNFNRNSPYANAALVVTVDFKRWFGNDLMAGVRYRRELETKAHQAVLQGGGSKQLPAQRLIDFMEGRVRELGGISSPSGAVPTRLDQILPAPIVEQIRLAVGKFDQNMKGFVSEEAQFFGVESRTSCPLRIVRDEESFQSVSHSGLYPCGEGAGYAGGITSAACDGIRVAEAIFKEVE